MRQSKHRQHSETANAKPAAMPTINGQSMWLADLLVVAVGVVPDIIVVLVVTPGHVLVPFSVT